MTTGTTEHECDRGWKWVGRDYAASIAEHVEGTVPPDTVIAALANSVYPCRVCKPASFYRWANGHFAQGHDVAGCTDCAQIHGGVKAARRHVRGGARQDPRPPTPSDEDAPPEFEPPRRDLE